MRRIAALLLVVAAIAVACSSDEAVETTTTTTGDGALTDEARAWCSFLDASEESASRFDMIFESGLALGLNMDAVNAVATAKLAEYRDAGLSEDDAILATSLDLFELEAFVRACEDAYSFFVNPDG